MKTPIFYLLFAGLLTLGGCKKENLEIVPESKDLGQFSDISVTGSWDVNLVKSDRNYVEYQVERRMLGHVKIEVRGNTLEIGTKCCRSPRKAMKATVYLTTLDGIDVSGSGYVFGHDTFPGSNWEMDVSGSGRISVPLSAQNLDVRISGSGNIEAFGTADKQSVNISGSGLYQGFGLQTSITNARISGSGRAEVSVSSELDVDISGSGNVHYRGNPSKVNSNISGSGSVTKD